VFWGKSNEYVNKHFTKKDNWKSFNRKIMLEKNDDNKITKENNNNRKNDVHISQLYMRRLKNPSPNFCVRVGVL